ncbi:hypothetical protein VUR80DRAFT_2699 [Thermomyces stellatus]
MSRESLVIIISTTATPVACTWYADPPRAYPRRPPSSILKTLLIPSPPSKQEGRVSGQKDEKRGGSRPRPLVPPACMRHCCSCRQNPVQAHPALRHLAPQSEGHDGCVSSIGHVSIGGRTHRMDHRTLHEDQVNGQNPCERRHLSLHPTASVASIR